MKRLEPAQQSGWASKVVLCAVLCANKVVLCAVLCASKVVLCAVYVLARNAG